MNSLIRKKSAFFSTIFLAVIAIQGNGQDIPLGAWRLHLSYQSIHQIAVAPDAVYGATASGILIYDPQEESIGSLNTLNGLSGTGISALAWGEGKLLVGYDDGNLDIIGDAGMVNFQRIRNAIDVPGSKRINHMAIRNGTAYLSTDFGVVVFDLTALELRETWRGLGAQGAPVEVNESAFKEDSIFLATSTGILAGDLDDNLLDFNNWKRFDIDGPAGDIKAIAVGGQSMFAAVNGVGLFRYENGEWALTSHLQSAMFVDLDGSESSLLITTSEKVFRLDANGVLTEINDPHIAMPLTAASDVNGNVWVGDSNNGLLSNRSGSFEAYLPNGPHTNSAFRLRFFREDGKATIALLPGGFSSSGEPFNTDSRISLFRNGLWAVETVSVSNPTDLEAVGPLRLIGSFGDGLLVEGTSSPTIFDASNSTLQGVGGDPEAVYVSAIQESNSGAWVFNYGAIVPLHYVRNGEWTSFSLPLTAGRYATDMVVDFTGQVWMVIQPSRGGGVLVYNYEQDAISYRTEGMGNGNLLSDAVRCIALDKDGYVWVGSDEGVAYFFSATADATVPIYQNRFLLRTETVNDIEVDGGNRKWIATRNGAWLFSPSGEELVHYFNEANSPLLSDEVLDIEINDDTGEIFFATARGVISYRGDATETVGFADKVKIFPNPVTSAFAGTVAIDGLAYGATVKITDISGKLIWQADSNGGSATWNVRDYNGRRAATGIYVVFAATADGAESIVGKIAVVD